MHVLFYELKQCMKSICWATQVTGSRHFELLYTDQRVFFNKNNFFWIENIVVYINILISACLVTLKDAWRLKVRIVFSFMS